MKNFFLLLALITLGSFVNRTAKVKTKLVKVTYISERLLDKEKLQLLPPEIRETVLKPQKCILTSSLINSLFYFEGDDEVLKDEKKSDSNYESRTKIIYKNGGVIYKEFPDKIIYSLKTIREEDYLIQSPLESRNWKILSEKAEVAGIMCQKAVTEFKGVTTEAWFAVDIPISDGPGIYNGLPGLILKIENPSIKQYAVSVEFPEEANIDKPLGKMVSQEEYEHLLKESNFKKETTDGSKTTRTSSKLIRID